MMCVGQTSSEDCLSRKVVLSEAASLKSSNEEFDYLVIEYLAVEGYIYYLHINHFYLIVFLTTFFNHKIYM